MEFGFDKTAVVISSDKDLFEMKIIEIEVRRWLMAIQINCFSWQNRFSNNCENFTLINIFAYWLLCNPYQYHTSSTKSELFQW